MKIELPAFNVLYDDVCQLAGQWNQYAIKAIDKTSLYLQRPPLAYLALIGANILFFESALAICRLGNYFFNCSDYYSRAQEREKLSISLCFGATFIATLGGANWLFCRMLRLPISSGKIGLVSATTCIVYLYFKSKRKFKEFSEG